MRDHVVPTESALRAFDRQNLAIATGLVLAFIALLVVGSHVATPLVVAVACLLSPLSLLADNVLHLALHGTLHRDARVNDLVGRVVSTLLLPMSFSLKREGHVQHHRLNRTERECFDLILDEGSRTSKRLSWFSVLFGLYSLVPPSVTFAFAIAPTLAARTIGRTPLLGPVFERGIEARQMVRRVRAEAALICAMWGALLWLLPVDGARVAVLLGAYAFTWSSVQYVGHAFASRHVVDGAHDLAAGTLLSRLLLNGQLERTHHRHPRARWQLLPALRAAHEPLGASWLAHYAALWGGPRPSDEPEPEPLHE